MTSTSTHISTDALIWAVIGLLDASGDHALADAYRRALKDALEEYPLLTERLRRSRHDARLLRRDVKALIERLHTPLNVAPRHSEWFVGGSGI